MQDRFATSGSRTSRDDVFSHRPGEALSLRPSTCVTSCEVCAPDKDVFLTRPDDESPGPSQGDCVFLDLLSKEVSVTESGNIQLPLPFRLDKTYYYSDSMVVLGYLANNDRRYTLYVARRVQMTLIHTSISDWSYESTLENPANFSSRPTLPEALINSFWYSGPSFLQNSDFSPIPYDPSTVQEPLPEERPSK